MMDELTTVTIHNKICHIYKNGCSKKENNGENRCLPVFYWGVGRESRASVETVVSFLKGRMPDVSFILTAYECENWNDDFSPWAASAVFGKEGFGGKANDTRNWLIKYCISYIEAKEFEIARFSVGYSLAGLFGLWIYCECNHFAGAVSCSGSLWYERWLEYVEKAAEVRADKTRYLYLSLGDKEEKAKNRQMSMVGDNTRKVYTMLCEKQENVKGVLEWNPGGHFSEPDLRIAKGIDWILRHFAV